MRLQYMSDANEETLRAIELLNDRFGILNHDLLDFSKKMKKGTATYDEHRRAIESLDKSLEKLDDEFDAKTAAEKRRALLAERSAIQQSAAVKGLEEAVSKATTSITTSAINGSAAFIKSMQSGANATKISSDLLTSAVDITASATSGVGQGIQSMGAGMTAMPGKIGKFGFALTAVGGIIEGLTPAMSGLAKFGIAFMTQELEKTTNSLRVMTSAGASFSGGLTELRQVSTASGVGIETFTKIVADTQPTFHALGITGTESTRLLSQGMNSLTKTVKLSNGAQISTRDQLLNLGYSYEEQGSIMALFMQQQKIAGKNLANIAPAELAKQTKEYAINLKAISDITGKDAKKLLEKAQAESMRGALLGKLTEDQQKSFGQAYATVAGFGDVLGPKMQIAMEQILSGGSVTDPIIAANEDAMILVNKMVAGVTSGNKNMIAETQQNMHAMGVAARDSSLGLQTDFARLEGITDPMIAGLAETNNAAIAFSNSTNEAGQLAVDTAKAQAETMDPASRNFAAATAAVEDFKVKMEAVATDLMPKYTNAMVLAIDTTKQLVTEAMRIAGLGPEATKQHTATENLMHLGESAATGAGIGMLGGSFAPITVPVGAIIGMGKAIYDIASDKGYANGGVASGPISGYTEKLHGTEAVVPLPDGRTIPVTMDSSSITNAINQQNAILSNILDTMNKNNQLTSRILQSSY